MPVKSAYGTGPLPSRPKHDVSNLFELMIGTAGNVIRWSLTSTDTSGVVGLTHFEIAVEGMSFPSPSHNARAASNIP